jgi:DNA-binding LacI/PurR family transcriptional regulator
MADTPPTLRQIAERAGVDRSTVSLALRNDPRLKKATCKKIQSLAAQMGYRQNPTVAKLMSLLRAGQKHHFHSTIAVLSFGPMTIGSKMIMEGAAHRARSLGYGFEIFQANDLTPKRLKQVLINRGIRGILVTSQLGGNRLPDEYRTLWTGFSSCVVGIHPMNPPLHFVADDCHMTILTAVQRLGELGFLRIGLAMHRAINIQTEYRFTGGFVAAHMASPELKPAPILFLEAGDQSRASLLTWYKKHKPEVIICIQTEVLKWLREDGYEVPRDVSLVSLDVDSAGQEWAGMQTGRFNRGCISTDVIVAQINCNETGVPESQRATLTESVWRPGGTLKPPLR